MLTSRGPSLGRWATASDRGQRDRPSERVRPSQNPTGGSTEADRRRCRVGYLRAQRPAASGEGGGLWTCTVDRGTRESAVLCPCACRLVDTDVGNTNHWRRLDQRERNNRKINVAWLRAICKNSKFEPSCCCYLVSSKVARLARGMAAVVPLHSM